MTKNEIMTVVMGEYERLEESKRGVCSDSRYQLGKIQGMLKTFELLGYITRKESCEIFNKVFE